MGKKDYMLLPLLTESLASFVIQGTEVETDYCTSGSCTPKLYLAPVSDTICAT